MPQRGQQDACLELKFSQLFLLGVKSVVSCFSFGLAADSTLAVPAVSVSAAPNLA
jgi:hypothetical protein